MKVLVVDSILSLIQEGVVADMPKSEKIP